MVFSYLRTKINVWVSSYVPPPSRESSAEPRRILLVHAHPRSDSYSHALADAVEAGAKEGGHALRRFSLYGYDAEEKGELGCSFQPCLTAAEIRAYGDTAQGESRRCLQRRVLRRSWRAASADRPRGGASPMRCCPHASVCRAQARRGRALGAGGPALVRLARLCVPDVVVQRAQRFCLNHDRTGELKPSSLEPRSNQGDEAVPTRR